MFHSALPYLHHPLSEHSAAGESGVAVSVTTNVFVTAGCMKTEFKSASIVLVELHQGL